jgi:hypothetical protein
MPFALFAVRIGHFATRQSAIIADCMKAPNKNICKPLNFKENKPKQHWHVVCSFFSIKNRPGNRLLPQWSLPDEPHTASAQRPGIGRLDRFGPATASLDGFIHASGPGDGCKIGSLR